MIVLKECAKFKEEDKEIVVCLDELDFNLCEIIKNKILITERTIDQFFQKSVGLEHPQKITLLFGMDFLFDKLEKDIVRRFGASRCWKAKFKKKVESIGWMLTEEPTRIDEVLEALENSKPYPVEGIFSLVDATLNLEEYYVFGLPHGLSTGWKNVDRLYTVKPGEVTVVTGIPSHGKALAIDTLIPTPDGWKLMAELKVGDKVFDENGKVCNVVNATEIMAGHDCFEIGFSDGTKIIADADHQWFTSTEQDRRSKRQQIKKQRLPFLRPKGSDQTYKRKFPSVKTTRIISETLNESGKINHHINSCGPVEYPEKILPIHPYVLGAWLGDGTSANGGFSSADVELINKIKACGYSVPKRKAKYSWGIKKIQPLLRELDLLNNKHIPPIYLRASVSQRLDLLRGLMDTDGHCHKSGQMEFCQVKEHLADQVLELCRSMAIVAKKYIGDATINGKFISKKYRICFYTDLEVFYLSRKLKNQNSKKTEKYRRIYYCKPVKSIPVKCIEVDSPNHLYLCSQSFIPTHNSSFVDALVVNMLFHHGWKAAYYTPEAQPFEIHTAGLMERLSGKPFDEGKRERMSLEEFEFCRRWLNDRIFYIMPKEPTFAAIKERAKALIIRHGINALVIDPWNQIEHSIPAGMNETQYISLVMTEIFKFARSMNLTIWLVAHPKKMDRNRKDGVIQVPEPYDIAGSATFRDKADNILCVYRNILDVISICDKCDGEYEGIPPERFCTRPAPTNQNPFQTCGGHVRIRKGSATQIHVQKVKLKTVGHAGTAKLNYDYNVGIYWEGDNQPEYTYLRKLLNPEPQEVKE